eukprot:3508442-Prymnesium_polylepis.1
MRLASVGFERGARSYVTVYQTTAQVLVGCDDEVTIKPPSFAPARHPSCVEGHHEHVGMRPTRRRIRCDDEP